MCGNKKRTEPRHEGLKGAGGPGNRAKMGDHANCEGTRRELRGTLRTWSELGGLKTPLGKKIFVLFFYFAASG